MVVFLAVDFKLFKAQMFHYGPQSSFCTLLLGDLWCRILTQQQSMTVHALAHTHSDLLLGACVPAGEHSRPCRRDSCAGPSRPRPPSERCAARGPSSSPCRVCGRARCARSWSKAAPPRCHRTARPARRGSRYLFRTVVQDKPEIYWNCWMKEDRQPPIRRFQISF